MNSSELFYDEIYLSLTDTLILDLSLTDDPFPCTSVVIYSEISQNSVQFSVTFDEKVPFLSRGFGAGVSPSITRFK